MPTDKKDIEGSSAEGDTPGEKLRATVPKTTPINWGVRDLRSYVGEEEQELIDEELYPHQKYEMGVIPGHVQRALKSGMVVGSLNALGGAGSTLYEAATSGGASTAAEVGAGLANSITGAAGTAANTAKGAVLGPFKLPGALRDSYNQYQDIVDARLGGEISKNQVRARAAASGLGLGQNLIGAIPTVKNVVNQYRDPGRQTAETAARRLAKAKRKRDRREGDMSLLEGYYRRPLRDKRKARQAVQEGEGDEEFEISFAPGG